MARRDFSPAYLALAARVLGLLSQETRLRLVLCLAQGEATVGTLSRELDLTQSNTSHHLSLLRQAGLVEDERRGQFVVYRLRVATWRRIGDGFFDRLLGGANEVALQHFRITRQPATLEPRAEARRS